LGYSPLEQVWGGKAYPASDLYSLGVTAFYLMSGISPREILVTMLEETSPEQAHNWVKHWRKYVQQPVSDNLGGVMDKLLHIDHKQRYQSASDALSDLNRGQHSTVATKRASVAPPQSAPNSFKPLKLFLAGSIGSIVLLVLVLSAMSPSSTTVGEVSTDLGDRSENAYAYLERGRTRSAAENNKEALLDLNQAVQLQPTAESYNERGQVRDKLKDKQGALADFDEAVKLKPEWGEVYYQRSSVQKDLGNDRQALADLDKAIGLQSDHLLARIERGNLRAKIGNKSQALQDFNEAIQLDARSSYAYMSRAGLFASANEKIKAISDYDRALALDPSSAYMFNERGILHQELNNKAKAKADFQMALQIAKKAGSEKDYANTVVRLEQLK
jgi:tetratricopeptide (TPR) repeat protein